MAWLTSTGLTLLAVGCADAVRANAGWTAVTASAAETSKAAIRFILPPGNRRYNDVVAQRTTGTIESHRASCRLSRHRKRDVTDRLYVRGLLFSTTSWAQKSPPGTVPMRGE